MLLVVNRFGVYVGRAENEKEVEKLSRREDEETKNCAE